MRQALPAAMVAMLAVVGCGRLDYDLVGADEDGGDRGDHDDAGTGNPPVTVDAHPASDGAVAVTFPTDERRLTSEQGASRHPVAVWSGAALYIVWDDDRGGDLDVYLSRLTPEDEDDPRDLPLTGNPAAQGFPSAAWAGDHLAVVWEDNRDGDSDIYFAGFDAAGERIGGEHQATTNGADSYDPSIAWSGGQHAIAYHEGDESHTAILVRRVSTDLDDVGPPVPRSNGPALSQFASLVWTGDAYGVVWQDNRDGAAAGYFGALATSGPPAHPEVRVTSQQSRVSFPVLAWSGHGYGMAWADARAGHLVIYFTSFDAEGERSSPEIAVSTGSADARNPSLVWTGDGYGLAWAQGEAIYLAILDASGESVADPLRVSEDDSVAAEPSLVWMAGQFGVAWQDARHGDEEIYVRAVTP